MSDEPQVRARVQNGVGHLTLNRPRAINALTHRMIISIRDALGQWRTDSRVHSVLLDGAGDRGLCAGGDIRGLRENVLDDRPNDTRDFWRDEYTLCAVIANYPKPYTVLMDGVTMGGGVGVASHGSIRVVTERSKIAMPETRIGLAPDIGGTWLLSRAPGEIGTYLGLNAATMSGADAVWCGFADHLVPSTSLPMLRDALLAGEEPTAAVARLEVDPGPAPLAAEQRWIDACYSAETVPEIIDRLVAAGTDAARAALSELAELCPTSLVATLMGVRRSGQRDQLGDVLDQEYRTSSWLLDRPDLVEGIRARVVDKDNAPRWNPATLAEVDVAEVERVIA
ncbi:enoyl-CoA hydratase/isomerase family protein [Paramicrobacterium chengjingii]|uniref:3-hydroxyisobutyryl-CoA hydrolase n=1 Tax=Paramicrobacterium chengjingii TaxID=2769067 RepID=A0ABX6YKA5_9MICO|nr:enoyl-CoA hydratase/isomerase family protein [Microbacterium chengjingii]QPZ38777.1 enoyl-CoA hydratase/isomerase family protein [Microbacterium chengjingii]